MPDSPGRPARLELRGWGWRHAGRRDWAVRGLDLVVEPGERVLLLGPSGAGKSTLLAALAGLPDPQTAGEAEGEMTLDGRPTREMRLRAGLVLQDPETQLVMARSGDDVAFGLENRGVPAEQIWPRVGEALAAVGFPYALDRSTHELSGGEKQRLAIAGVLALRPGLLLLDEPTANLDPAGAALVRDAMSVAMAGATTILVEHRVAQVMHLVDRVVVIAAGGGVVADGRPAQVFAEHGETLAAQGVWLPGRSAAPPRRSPRSPGPVVLDIDRASFRYPGGRMIVAPDGLAPRAGEAVALTGPNGIGKSTLAMMVAGLLAPAAGSVRSRADRAKPLYRWRAADLVRTVGMVFQEPEHQFLTRTVRDEVALGPRRLGLDGAVADELLARLRLEKLAAANPFTLSGGEKRRLSVAAALATRPRLLVLDEPTFGQDATTWAELLGMLADLRDAGSALLAVTHDEEFAHALADRRVAA